MKTIVFLIVLLSVTGFELHGDPLPKDPTPKQKGGQYVFKPIEITPSPDGEHYEGRFLFINKGPSPVVVYGFGEPKNGKFDPRFIQFQSLQRNVWKDLPVGYCGTGTEEFPINPNMPLEFTVSLFDFEEQDAPLTCRIAVNDFWSEPFELDWKKDRKGGRFVAAKKERFEKVREAFIKAGFKKEKLAGDDFCKRLFQSMMSQTSVKDELLFKPFRGELDVIPEFLINGNIRIDFESNGGQDHGYHYEGWFVLNPQKFTPQWFGSTARDLVRVYASESDNSVQMQLGDDSGIMSDDAILYLRINYGLPKKSKRPSLDTSKKVFMRMLDALQEWLTPAT